MSQPWTSPSSASLERDGGVVTLVEGTAFAISSPAGDVEPGLPHGLFFRDTRFLSELRLRVNGHWPEPLAASTLDPFTAVFVLRDQPTPGLADSVLMVFRTRYVGRGMREDVVVRNYGLDPAPCALELFVDADFADLFAVKEGRIESSGVIDVEVAERRLTWRYRHGRFSRGVHLDLGESGTVTPGGVAYEVVVPPGGEWSTCFQVTPVIE